MVFRLHFLPKDERLIAEMLRNHSGISGLGWFPSYISRELKMVDGFITTKSTLAEELRKRGVEHELIIYADGLTPSAIQLFTDQFFQTTDPDVIKFLIARVHWYCS